MFKKLQIFLLLNFFYSIHFSCAAEYHVLGIGAPCIDLVVPVEEETLATIPGKKGGSEQIDWPSFSQILLWNKSKNFSLKTGGSCANTIKGLAALEKPCALLGKIGDDEMGKYFLRVIEPLKITSLLFPSNTPTAQVACLITPDKQRTFRCFPGAGNELTGDDLSPLFFENVPIVHIEGYTLYNPGLTEQAMILAKQAGALVSFDLGAFELVEIFRDRIWNLLENYVDIVFANEDETFALTNQNPKKGCLKMQSVCPIAVVLIGSQGCLVGSKGRIIHVPTHKVDVIDTTGAGDLFISGFLYGLVEDLTLAECGSIGNLIGGSVIQNFGAEIPPASWKTIRKKLRFK